MEKNKRYRIGMLVILGACALTMSPGLVADQPASQIDTWMETLRFGIDTEVEATLDAIGQSGTTELDDALASRFETTRSNSLRTAIVEHFASRESPFLGPQVRRLLLADETLPNDLLRVTASYLSRVAMEEGGDLLARYREIAVRSDVLSATVAIDAIGRSASNEAEDLLLALYDDLTDVDRRSAVMRALGLAGGDRAVELLTRVATDEFEIAALRHYAAESLGRIGAPESLTILNRLLADPDSVLRAYATLAVGFYPISDTASILQNALLDSFWRVRVAALQAIAEQQDTTAVPAATYKARRDPERPVREQAITTLGAIGTADALATLATISEDRRAAERERILSITLLIEKSGPTHLETIGRIIEEEWAIANSRLLDTIGKTVSTSSDTAWEPMWLKFLTHPNYIIRIYGMRGVGAGGSVEHADTLKDIARTNPAGLIRTTAVTALERLGIEFDPEAESEPDGTANDAGDGPDGTPPEDAPDDNPPSSAPTEDEPDDDW